MNSFDVFDTLIARRFYTTNSVWKQIGVEYNLKNFEIDRPKPDDGTRTFQEIYNELVRLHLIPSELKNLLMDREVELEIDNSFGIIENLDKVQEGDLLISDMYLPAHVILQMVRAAGLNKQVTIHQSNRDKGTGRIWNILSSNPPDLHLGDNLQTDVIMPTHYGIRTQHYKDSNYTSNENFLMQNNLYNIAHLVREIRLSNNIYNSKEYFQLANQFNLPLIFVMLEQINRSIQTPITFLGRDCQSMHKIFNAYFRTAYYLPFSRKVAYLQPEISAIYLNTMKTDDMYFVDISSTGETWNHMAKFGCYNVKSIIYGDAVNRPYLPNTFSYITKNSQCGDTNLMLEILNCADHGVLDNLQLVGNNNVLTTFGERELPDEIIIAVQTPIYDAVNLCDYYRVLVKNELHSLSDDQLAALFRYFTRQICKEINLSLSIPNFHNVETEYHQQIISLRKQINA